MAEAYVKSWWVNEFRELDKCQNYKDPCMPCVGPLTGLK